MAGQRRASFGLRLRCPRRGGSFGSVGIPAWTIRTPLGEYHAKVRFFGPSPEPEEAEDARSVWFFASCDIRNLEADAVEAALELSGELSGGVELSQRVRMDDARAEQLIEELDNALTAGLMYFERVEWSSPPSPDTEESEEAPPPQVEAPLDFIEVLLVDDSGSPVADVAYHLKMPNGQVTSGQTNHQGKCWVPRTPAGSCELTFTNLDGTAWAPS